MTFTPRLTSAGMQDNPWWYSNGNVYYQSGYGLPNCTCYAYGRWGEIRNAFNPDLSGDYHGDAKYFWTRSPNLQKGQVPQLGAVACYGTYDDDYGGHVSVVEEIDETNGSITTSNSAYNGAYFWTDTCYVSDNYLPAWCQPSSPSYSRPYYFQGFIYLDGYVPPTPPPSHRRKSKWWMYLRYYPW